LLSLIGCQSNPIQRSIKKAKPSSSLSKSHILPSKALTKAQLDSFIINKYIVQIKQEYVEDSTLVGERLDSAFEAENEGRVHIGETRVVYSPDSAFKIFTIEVESCGSYCNSEYKTYIHYTRDKKELIKAVEYALVTEIHKPSDQNYLLIESAIERPVAAAAPVTCKTARHIAFNKDSLIVYPIRYKGEDKLMLCDDPDSFNLLSLKYNAKAKSLIYKYASTHFDDLGKGIDTIRTGSFKYLDYRFLLQKEKVVIERRKQ